MSNAETVWLVEDDPDVALSARLALRDLANVERLAHPSAALRRLGEATAPHAVLLDLNFARGASDGSEGLAAIDEFRRIAPHLPVVVVTAHASLDLAVAAIKRGASDFVTKPWEVERLRATVRAALALAGARRSAQEEALRARELARTGRDDAPPLLGDSAPMRRVRELLARVAPTEANVLLLGENGTGKELAARELHRLSTRAAQPFVAVDLGAVAESLFESELFGHRKGAFTDARSDRIGRLPAAHGGTLFLDEIGNLPLPLQPKLLTALERRQVVPVGATAPLPIDVRIVAATNLAREQLGDARRFRPDLLFRLNTVEIELPPLRARPEDIAPIAAHYARWYARRYGKPERGFSERALARMRADPWPGNVRALRHAVERATILAQGAAFEAEDLALYDAAPPLPSSPATTPGGADELNLEVNERALVERALRRHGYNISLAARDLGLSRAALYRRMERHGL
jgi:DNA-binding NtrC family response regulator